MEWKQGNAGQSYLEMRESKRRNPELVTLIGPYTMFGRGRERKACADVFGLQGRKIGQDLTLSHSTREVFEDIGDRDPRPFDARLTAANSRRDRDVVLEPHSSK